MRGSTVDHLAINPDRVLNLGLSDFILCRGWSDMAGTTLRRFVMERVLSHFPRICNDINLVKLL